MVHEPREERTSTRANTILRNRKRAVQHLADHKFWVLRGDLQVDRQAVRIAKTLREFLGKRFFSGVGVEVRERHRSETMRWMRRATGPAAWHRTEGDRLLFVRYSRTLAVPLIHGLTALDLADHLIP